MLNRLGSFMNQNYDYPKPKSLRKALGTILGEGVLTVEGQSVEHNTSCLKRRLKQFIILGDIHKRHRRTMLPSFSGQSIRSLFPIFMEKAVQITQKILEDSVDKDGTPDTACEKGASKLTTEGVNVLSWMVKCLLYVFCTSSFCSTFLVYLAAWYARRNRPGRV